jgi:hypothetical protein
MNRSLVTISLYVLALTAFLLSSASIARAQFSTGPPAQESRPSVDLVAQVGHDVLILAIAISPDGQTLASADGNGKVNPPLARADLTRWPLVRMEKLSRARAAPTTKILSSYLTQPLGTSSRRSTVTPVSSTQSRSARTGKRSQAAVATTPSSCGMRPAERFYAL